MKNFAETPPKGAGFFMMIVLDPDQNMPVMMGWGTQLELRAAADEYVSKKPRCRAYLLKTVSEISAVTTLREIDPDTAQEIRGAPV